MLTAAGTALYRLKLPIAVPAVNTFNLTTVVTINRIIDLSVILIMLNN